MVTTTALFKADKNVVLTLNGGTTWVTLGDGSGVATVLGGVTVKTGAGNDQVVFDQVSVTGPVLVTTLGGADTLAIDDETAFLVRLHRPPGGDDTILVAQNPAVRTRCGSSARRKSWAGWGTTCWPWGWPTTCWSAGDGNTRAQFTVPTSLVDGGLGFNSIAPDAQFDPASVIVVHWV